MNTRMAVIVSMLMAVPLWAAEQSKPVAHAGFEKLKTLVGDWKGSEQGGGEVHTSYKLVAGGSALQENLSHMDMVTMYHVDGRQLMLTHYCAVQNQPRMRAAAFKDGDNSLKFSFVDATNMPDKKATHMHNVVLTFKDHDHFTQEWTLYQEGKESRKVVMEFERVK